MKKAVLFFILLSSLHLHSSAQSAVIVDKEKIRKEISAAEKNFQQDLATGGVAYAFHKYAAENAVIKREGDTLIRGREAIKNYYSNPSYKAAVAEWSPDFIDVSGDGSMAYTYGKYKWRFTDKDGKVNTYEGVFHTVWKRQAGGVWRYVWD